jgi:lipocalin
VVLVFTVKNISDLTYVPRESTNTTTIGVVNRCYKAIGKGPEESYSNLRRGINASTLTTLQKHFAQFGVQELDLYWLTRLRTRLYFKAWTSKPRRRDYKSKDEKRVVKFKPRFDGPYEIIKVDPKHSTVTLNLPRSRLPCLSYFRNNVLHRK